MQVQQVGGVRGTFPQGGRFSGSMNFFGGKRFSGAGTEAKAKNPHTNSKNIMVQDVCGGSAALKASRSHMFGILSEAYTRKPEYFPR